MPIATDFGGFGLVGVPLFNNPATGFTQQWPAHTVFNPGPWNKPVSGEFTTIGQTYTTIADRADRLILTCTSFSGKVMGLMKPLPATPYTIDVIGGVSGVTNNTADGVQLGIGLYDGTKVESVTAGDSAQATKTLVQTWTNANTNSATPFTFGGAIGTSLFGIRVTDDGTNRQMLISGNAKEYSLFFSEATNTFLTPTQAGILTYSGAQIGSTVFKFYIHHFKISSGILGDQPW